MPIIFLFRRADEDRGLVDEVREVGPGEAGRLAGDALEVDALSRGLPLAWTLRIAVRPFMSGRSRMTWRSKRPGRSSAGSSTSGRLVAATTITFVFVSKPSISTRIWLRVCSRSSCEPPRPAPRWRPTASISSTNTMHGRVALGLVEQVAHAAGADAHEHLDELRAGDAEEGHAGLAGDRAGEQGLAGAWGPDEQDAARDARTERVELLGVLEELDDLLELRLGLVDAGDVVERDDRLVAEEHPRTALAERQGLVIGALGLSHHEEDEAADEQQRQQPGQQQPEPRVVGDRLDGLYASGPSSLLPFSAAACMSP